MWLLMNINCEYSPTIFTTNKKWEFNHWYGLQTELSCFHCSLIMTKMLYRLRKLLIIVGKLVFFQNDTIQSVILNGFWIVILNNWGVFVIVFGFLLPSTNYDHSFAFVNTLKEITVCSYYFVKLFVWCILSVLVLWSILLMCRQKVLCDLILRILWIFTG